MNLLWIIAKTYDYKDAYKLAKTCLMSGNYP